MTDLDDEVRDTFSAPPDYAPRALDFDQIIVSGNRLRRRRTVLTGAASAAAVLALIVGGAQLIGLPGKSGLPTAPPAATVSIDSAPAAKIEDNTNNLAGPLGQVIDTGAQAKNGNPLVIFGTTGSATDGSYGFSIGERLPDGNVNEWWTINENPDRMAVGAPGFHATQYPESTGNDDSVPGFGYYVGNPAKITSTYHGRTIVARLAPWSYRPGVTVFWFDLTDTPGHDITAPRAYDAGGTELPVGDNTVQDPG